MRIELTIISDVGIKNLSFEIPKHANLDYIIGKANYFCRVYAFDSLRHCFVLKPHYNEDEIETIESIDLAKYFTKCKNF